MWKLATVPQWAEERKLDWDLKAWCGEGLCHWLQVICEDNRTFHSVRKGVISKGTQGHCIGEIRTTALYILSSLNMFPRRILSLSCYASFKFKFVYSLCHSFILSKVCVKHNYVCYERENQPCFHGTCIVLGSYNPKVSNLSSVHNCCD